MLTLLSLVLVASLLGSLHCAGMCGPLVAVYAAGDASRGLRRGLSHAVYSAGRLVAYAVVGAVAGSVGAALDLAGNLVGVQRITGIVAGVLIVLWGIVSLLQIRGYGLDRLPLPSSAQRLLSSVFAGVREKPPVVKAAIIGLASALLPCGWLYFFVMIAAGTGGPLRGALVTTAFWVGTLPVMVSLGLGIQAVAGPFRKHLQTVAALVMIALGMYSVVTRWDRLAGKALPDPASSLREALGRLDDEEKQPTHPCCEPADGEPASSSE